jgi:hypothetical protein
MIHFFASFTKASIIRDNINANNTRSGSKEESKKCACLNVTTQFGSQKEASCRRW